MRDANAPARPTGLRRWLAALVLAVGLPTWSTTPVLARQQDEPAKGADPKAEAEPQGEPAEEPAAQEPTPEEADQQDVLSDSIFVDPQATAAMRGTYEQLHASVLVPTNTDAAIARMARGEGRVDSGLIDRYLKYAARQLTDRENIAAVTTPTEGVSSSAQNRIQAIQEAGRYLMVPYLEVPPDRRDGRFSQEYNSRLLALAPDLLKHHLYPRVQVMQALSRMGDPQAMGLLLEQLGDPEQPLIVRQLAAEGIRRIAVESGNALPAADRERAAAGLVAFVRDNPQAYWLALARALQALGTLRQISGVQTRDQAVFAVEALAVLLDENARPETRGWAAWALGMLDVPPSYPQLNFTLPAYHIGQLAVEIGERIVELSDPREAASFNPERVKYLTGLLVSPIFASLDGDPALRGSGLRNSRGLGPHQQYVLRVHQLVRQLTAESVELTRAVGGQRAERRDRVIASLNELRTFLGQNRPEDGTFVPGGREFALQDSP